MALFQCPKCGTPSTYVECVCGTRCYAIQPRLPMSLPLKRGYIPSRTGKDGKEVPAP